MKIKFAILAFVAVVACQFASFSQRVATSHSTSPLVTVSIDGDDMQHGYADSQSSATFDGVGYVFNKLARYVNAVPLQFQSKNGYIYNTTPLERLSQIVITISGDSKYRHMFTLYAGAEQNPVGREVLAKQSGSKLVYSLPEGCSYFAIHNKSRYAAYAKEISISYGASSRKQPSVKADNGPSVPRSGHLDQPPALSASSPYNIAYAPRWGEVPAYIEDKRYLYVTHSANLNNKNMRNYSLCYDTKSRAALWVAFPYHEVYSGDTDRTDDWGFDSVIAKVLQADLRKAYAPHKGVTYDRGHQISSADRLSTEEFNAQTFYYSNMTPQNSSLNRGQWAALEEDVRAQVCSDTLYVVTGADFTTTLGNTTDREDNICPIPAAFYKVMLRTRRGNTGKSINECRADELQSIGYWVENAYTGKLPEPVSVSEIESKTGLVFFPSVPVAVKQQCVKSMWVDL